MLAAEYISSSFDALSAGNEKGPIISIIIPVYNVKTYLDSCLNSLLEQVAQNEGFERALEVILVNDGSTDGSEKVCDVWAKRYKWIRVFHKENGGLSSARNYGLDFARGEYVQFVDSDDELAPGYLDTIFKMIKAKHPDVIIFPFSYLSEDGNKLTSAKKCNGYKAMGSLTQSEALKALFEDRLFSYAWSYVVQKKVFDSGIRFPRGYFLEDMATFYKIVLSVHKLEVIPDPLYLYRVRRGSITGTRNALVYKSGLWVANEIISDFSGTEYDLLARRWVLLYLCKWECSLIADVANISSEDKSNFLHLYDQRIDELTQWLSSADVGKSASKRLALLHVFKKTPRWILRLIYLLRDLHR